MIKLCRREQMREGFPLCMHICAVCMPVDNRGDIHLAGC